MATECSQESVLQFLLERGGRVKNVELIDHFKSVFPSDPARRTSVREAFKGYVDNVAFVKVENGVKIVCLKKKYKGSLQRTEGKTDGNGNNESNGFVLKQTAHGIDTSAASERNSACPDNFRSNEFCEENHVSQSSNVALTKTPVGKPKNGVKKSANSTVLEQKVPPRLDYGTAKEKPVNTSSVSNVDNYISKPKMLVAKRAAPAPPAVSKTHQNALLDMGHAINNNIKKSAGERLGESEHHIVNECSAQPAVINTSTSSMNSDGTVFNLNKPLCVKERSDDAPGKSKECTQPATQSENHGLFFTQGPPGDAVSMAKANEEEKESEVYKGASLGQHVSKRLASRGSQRSLLSRHPSEDVADEGSLDSSTTPGSDSSTPKSSRENFIELMMNSSPQVRRSMVHRNPGHLSARHKDKESSRSDSDSNSVVSSADEDHGPVMLDPLEHEWMMCASDGEWDSLHRLLTCDPSLVVKKDFVTGFTCLHWAAKQGKQELLALLVNFAKQHGVPLNINARSSAGYTPLHLAAMHNRIEVVKLLVGAYDADVEVRDYSGKKPAQYLTNGVSENIRDIIGAGAGYQSAESAVGRWKFPRVLQSNFKLLNYPEEDACDAAAVSLKSKPLYRKSSITKMKPRLQKIRFRTQIIHSTSFREAEEGESSATSPLKSRPKSNLFG